MIKYKLITTTSDLSRDCFEKTLGFEPPEDHNKRILVNKDSKEVEYLDLKGLNYDRIELERFLSIGTLKRVDLRNNVIKDVDITSFQDKEIFEKVTYYKTSLKTILDFNSPEIIFDKTTIIFITLYGTLHDDSIFQQKIPVDIPVLDLYGKGLNYIDLSPLRLFSNLYVLNLYANALKKLDLTPLEHCNNLQDLAFHSNKLKEIDLAPLSKCSRLAFLHFMGNKIESLDLKPLARCNILQKFDASNNNISEIDLTPFQNIVSLTKISFCNNKLTEIDLGPLKKCTGLQSLLLHSNKIEKIDLSPLSELPMLDWLELHGNQLTEIDLTPLKYSYNLSGLAIVENNIKVVDITPIIECEKLERSKYMRIEGLGSGLFINKPDIIIKINKKMKKKIKSPDIARLVKSKRIDWIDGEKEKKEVNAQHWYNLGHKAMAKKEIMEATKNFGKLSREHANIGNINYDLAFIYYYTKNYDKAIDYIQNAIKQNPYNDYLWELWAILNSAVGKRVTFTDQLLEIFEMEDLGPYAYNTIGKIFLYANLPERGEKYFKKTLIFNANFHLTWFELARTYHVLNRTSEAKKAIIEQIKSFSSWKPIWELARNIFLALDDKEEAEEALKEIRELEKQSENKQ